MFEEISPINSPLKNGIDSELPSSMNSYQFSSDKKSETICIIDGGTAITQNTFTYFSSYCFIEYRMSRIRFHIKYKHIYKSNCYVSFCFCQNLDSPDRSIYCNSQCYSFGFTTNGRACKYDLGKKSDLSNEISTPKSGDIYHFIVDFFKRTISLSINDDHPIELFKRIKNPLFNAVDIQQNSVVQLLSITSDLD